MHSDEKLVSDGARALRKYLDDQKTSVQKFCQQHSLDRVQVLRMLNGDLGKRGASVDFAEAIELATDGAVPMRAWHTRTLGPVAADDLPATGSDAR
jgi:hypothetical protein